MSALQDAPVPAAPLEEAGDVVSKYVKERGGTRPIRKVLIANNGMAATKAIMSMRRWAYLELGDEKAVSFAVMATPEDLNANAEFVRLADEYVDVPGGSNANNYANVKLIVDVARRLAVDGVWPGWGHASENPKLPRALKAAGIAFLGPPAPVMSVLGDKIAANILAQTAGVPSIPWSGSFGDEENDGPLKARLAEDGTIPEKVFQKACVHSVEEAVMAAKRVGYPVMLKASEGGGGKGIRMNEDEAELAANYQVVANEVPGSPIFVMQLMTGARHLEVQVVGDEHGNAIALNGRDCSTQRRFQKIFEEGPPTDPTGGIARADVFADMEQKARELVKSIGYVGAGTVEYLYDAKTDDYFFLELNPRLQVEHPVTEGITGVNMPATQLQVGMGVPLSNVPEIRNLYGAPRDDLSVEVNLDLPYELPKNRHVLAARITAENPDEGFKPTSGRIERVAFQSTPSVWGYFSVGANGGVHEFADSQFGHLFASGTNREEARKAMVLALKELTVRGEIRNPVEYLVQLLETDDFKSNNIDTSWLDGLLKQKAILPRIDDELVVAAAALFRSFEKCKSAKLAFEAAIGKGQFATSEFEVDEFDVEVVLNDVKYEIRVARTGEASFLTTIGDATFEATARERPDGTLLASLGGRSLQLTGFEEPLGLRLNVDGATIFLPTVFDPSEVRSDVTGKVVRWLVDDGEDVKAGVPFAEVEAMKMIMPLRAAETGTLRHNVGAGTVVESGDLLARLDLADPSKATKITRFEGAAFEVAGAVDAPSLEDEPLRNYEAASEKLATALDGWDAFRGEEESSSSSSSSSSPENAVTAMIDALATNKLVKLVARETAGAIGQKMPAALDAALVSLPEDATASDLDALLREYEDDPAALAPLRGVVDAWSDGPLGVAVDTVASLLGNFLAVEEKFVGRENEDAAIRELVKAASSPSVAADNLLAHAKLQRRCGVVLALVKALPSLEPLFESTEDISDERKARLENRLDRVAALEVAGPSYASVSLAAGMARLESAVPPFADRVASLREDLKNSESDLQAFATRPELGSFQRGVDMLTYLFDDEDEEISKAALEVYVRRMYSAHDMLEVEVGDDREARWWYKFRDEDPENAPLRFGKLVIRESADDLEGALDALPKTILPAYKEDCANKKLGKDGPAVNTLHVLLKRGAITDATEDASFAAEVEKALEAPETKSLVADCRLRSINVIAAEAPYYPRSFTFVANESNALEEDPLRRMMRPTFYHLLELDAISQHFALTPLATVNRDLRVYIGDEKNPKNPRAASQTVFVRRVTHSTDLADAGAERLFDKALDALEMAMLDSRVKPTSSASLYLTVIPPVSGRISDLDAAFKDIVGGLVASRAKRLLASRVDEISVKFYVDDSKSGPLEIRTSPLPPQTPLTTVRGVATSADGPWLRLQSYVEQSDKITGSVTGYCDLEGTNCVVDPYASADVVAKKRAAARRVGTTYAYDFVGLLATATLAAWRERAAAAADVAVPAVDDILEAKELLLVSSEDGVVSTKATRSVGTNDVGMVAWLCTFKTPEYPEGREVVLIANDVTYKSGSFGVAEDEFFAKVSNYAAEKGIPRVYVSSNSGARIGLVDALKDVVGVKWVDDSNPSSGLEYLYLTPDQLAALPEGSVVAKPLNEAGVHEIDAIVGAGDQVPDGIGVENLRGSGMIAGVTSRAYKDTFTLSYVTGRSVGIGAYLVRLGQRVIQMRQGPVILTGYSALNKLLGKQVYTSQDQLGGPQIMVPNGITHRVVDDDYEGCRAIVDWLSFVPKDCSKTTSDTAFLLPQVDPVDREVKARPTKTPYDVREVLDNGVDGLFDAGSFQESLAGWGKTVVSGRARLGGIPFGVIAVETRTVEAVVPADPANPDSREAVLPQAGQVWYPDSAFKTAQAIEDFNRGEHLPLMILANWRGFSGGTRDMFGEVLKFGAKIVDALTDYDRPVFVYIPPNGELRGGAWVVVDPTINADMMEMYADPDSRGGILEPPGVCEVKFRENERDSLMRRLDPTLADDPRREKTLAPVALQVAHEFADLHDRAGRMLAKGVVRDVVPWARARSYFYWRAKRRLAVDALAKQIRAATGFSFQKSLKEVETGFEDQLGDDWNDDRAVANYFDANKDRAADFVKAATLRAKLETFKSLLVDPDLQKDVDQLKRSSA
ncbi:hypothetical protein CTAYLR_007627 [Chrysophaeum taylorii]|uniref:Acetyl-CoA carboxylase n=1 Tax=Chrysophaeum taylorii TaxID=2483200 RepID=A0AAD7UH85_9STRA|nr:hypothetical protein CTAYLR_007627 [Chrysophaeum taylorii]